MTRKTIEVVSDSFGKKNILNIPLDRIVNYVNPWDWVNLPKSTSGYSDTFVARSTYVGAVHKNRDVFKIGLNAKSCIRS